MTKNDLLQKVEKIAYDFEYKYRGCTQCILGAFREILGEEVISDQVFKAGSVLSGGVGCSGHACGAITGSMMVIGLFRGRDINDLDNREMMAKGFKLGQPLIEKTQKKYGSINCYDIQEYLTGRHYSCWSEEDQKIANENGLFTKVCPQVIGEAARWTLEILIDEGLIDPEDY